MKGWGCFDDPDTGARPIRKNYYGFKTHKTPKLPATAAEYPHIDWNKIKEEVEILKEFEEELFKIPLKVKYKFFDNPLQRAMRSDLRTVHSSGKVIVKADKTRNFYAVPPNFYNETVLSSIGSDYAEVDEAELDRVNQEAAELAAVSYTHLTLPTKRIV